MKRTYALDTLKKISEKITLKGWSTNTRDHGQLIFIDFRDWTGHVQVVIDISKVPQAHAIASKLGKEWVVQITGTVIKRATNLINKDLPTGTIEVVCEEIIVLNKCKVLPFPIDTDGRKINENLRFKYRFLDLRRQRLSNILRKRHTFLQATRNWFNNKGFTEIQTPLLTSTTPEGARDFIIPSRIHKGKFFVLPQSPQQFKQLLMVGGVDKYFQIAPCARDEDPRADRHAGVFYQIDVEMSFPTQDDILTACENMINSTYKAIAPQKTIKQTPFPRISYTESLERYGTDKPDVRYNLELKTITDLVKDKTNFTIFNQAEVVKCINAENCGDWSRKQISDLEEHAKSKGAKGLAYMKVTIKGLEGGISKFFPLDVQQDIIAQMKAKPGDLLFFVAAKLDLTNKILDGVRRKLGELLKLTNPNELAFSWITDFPFYEINEDTGKLDFGHNPFSMIEGGIKSLKTLDPLKIMSQQYDLALNGFEVLSGSIRNHEPDTLLKAFEVVGYDKTEIMKKFGGMYNAFQYGAPPHGGFGLGIDRYFMILIDEPNIRDVYAFPKNSNGVDVLMNAPATVTEIQLKDTGVKLRKEVVEKLKCN